VLSSRLTRGSVLGHRTEVAGRRVLHTRGAASDGVGTTLPPALLRFVLERMVSVGLKELCPNLLALFNSAAIPAQAGVDTITLFLAGWLQRWAVELLDAGGVVATSYVTSTIQAYHLSEYVASQSELRALYVEHAMLGFTPQASADIDQLFPVAAHDAEGAPQQLHWWSPGVLTEARKASALTLLMSPEMGGYPESYTRYGIVPVSRQSLPAGEAEPALAQNVAVAPAGAAPGTKRTKGKRAAAAAAAAAAGSGVDEAAPLSVAEQARKIDTLFAQFAANFAAGLYRPSAQRVGPLPDVNAGVERYAAELELTDGAGNFIPVHVERSMSSLKSEGASAAAAASSNGPLPNGRVWNRSNGHVVADVLEPTDRHRTRVVLENATPLGRFSLALEARSYVPSAALTQTLVSPLASVQDSTELCVRVPPDEFELAAAGGNVPVPPLGLVVKQALSLVAAPPAESDVCYASSQPWDLRVDMRTRMLLKHAFVDVRHEIASRPEIMSIIAEFDPAYLPHTNLPPSLQVQGLQQPQVAAAAASAAPASKAGKQ
jgi:hypothetical protein